MDHVFTAREAAEAKKCLDLHLKAYYWLAAHFYSRRQLLFKLRCKSHYHFHMAEDVISNRLCVRRVLQLSTVPVG